MPAILSNQKVRRSAGSAALSTTGAVTPTAWYSWATVAGKFALYTGLIVSILPLGTATGGPVKLRSDQNIFRMGRELPLETEKISSL